MRGRGFLVAVVMASVSAIAAWSVYTSLTAKIPGETHCYKDVCHRVFSLDETRAMIGQTSDHVTTHYDVPGVDKFNVGQYTSSGEEFNAGSSARTSASNFPDGTELLVWHPVTRRAAHVRVNDFGPFWGKRTLDVTRRVAEDLGFAKDGVATLKVTVIWAPQAGEPRYRRGRTDPPTLGHLGVVERSEHQALVQRLIAGAWERNGYKGPSVPAGLGEVVVEVAETPEAARAAAEQIDRDASMVIAGLPRPPALEALADELVPLPIALGPPAFRVEAAEAGAQVLAEVVIAAPPVRDLPPIALPTAAPDIPSLEPERPVTVAAAVTGPHNPNQSTISQTNADERGLVEAVDPPVVSPLSAALLRSLADPDTSLLVTIGIAVMLTSLWGAGSLARSRQVRAARVPSTIAPSAPFVDSSDPLATARRAAAQAEHGAREALMRDMASGMRVPPAVAQARDDLGRELALREFPREAEVRARLKQMQDEQAALARELTALEAARVVEAQQVDRPRSALDDLEAQAARARDLEAMTAARRARDQAAEAEQAARAERDAKVAAMPKSLSRDLAAAVLGLPGSETYWGNILIAQAELRGTIEYGSPLRIDGRVDGACQAPVIMVSQGAAVTGTIAAETIVLLGPVCGTIVGRHVVITASASVEGDLVYQTLSLDQAAQCDLRFSRLPAGADPVLVAFPGTEMSRAA